MTNKTSILVVDDEADILEFLKYSLEQEGYEVTTASQARRQVLTQLARILRI